VEVIAAIAKKLEEPVYLFTLAVLIITGLAAYASNSTLVLAVLGLGFAVVLLTTVRDYVRGRGRMSVVLRFPEGAEASERQLEVCECTIGDPRDPRRVRKAQVRPIPAGDGWICPLPDGARSSDVIDFAMTDAGGRHWIARSFVLELQWPAVAVHEKKRPPA
jgi:hypothetical protein